MAKHIAAIERVHEAVLGRGGTEQSKGEWRFRCPYPDSHAHGDQDPSADWNPEKGAWCCRVCKQKGGYVALAGLLKVDLPVEAPDLDAFASERKIPVDILREFGVTSTVFKDGPALRFPTAIGIDRIKFLDGRKQKYGWAKAGGTAHLYGLDRALALLRKAARLVTFLYIVNGEPSVWACASRGVAAICFCAGEGTTPPGDVLQGLADDLKAIGSVSIRIAYDVDPAGQRGARKLAEALLANGLLDVVALDLLRSA